MRKSYSASFKAQVVLEMLKEQKSVAELASEYGVHPSILHRWRRQAVENLAQVFAEGEKLETVKTEYEHKIEELYKEIGRLTTQLEWLKKKGIRPD